MAIIGFLMMLVGLFSGIGMCAVRGAPCPSPRPDAILAYGGLVVLVVGVAVLLRSAWRGSFVSAVTAAIAVVPAVWFLYEIARQSGCPLLDEPETETACMRAFGEMTAPLLSYAAGALVLLIGGLRWRRTRPQVVSGGSPSGSGLKQPDNSRHIPGTP